MYIAINTAMKITSYNYAYWVGVTQSGSSQRKTALRSERKRLRIEYYFILKFFTLCSKIDIILSSRLFITKEWQVRTNPMWLQSIDAVPFGLFNLPFTFNGAQSICLLSQTVCTCAKFISDRFRYIFFGRFTEEVEWVWGKTKMKCPSKVDKREKELKQGFPRTFFF